MNLLVIIICCFVIVLMVIIEENRNTTKLLKYKKLIESKEKIIKSKTEHLNNIIWASENLLNDYRVLLSILEDHFTNEQINIMFESKKKKLALATNDNDESNQLYDE